MFPIRDMTQLAHREVEHTSPCEGVVVLRFWPANGEPAKLAAMADSGELPLLRFGRLSVRVVDTPPSSPLTPDDFRTPAVLTGSQVYGVPNSESDIDVVIEVAGEVYGDLLQYSDHPRLLRYGKLNLILTWSREGRRLWAKGTQLLLSEAPVTRDRAVAMFNELGVTGCNYNVDVQNGTNP